MRKERSSRIDLIDAGERLIAEVGVDIPLREIARAAGQRNNSAVHYHFGSRDGLIEAILDTRLGPLERRRAEMLAELRGQGRAEDVGELVRVLIEPMLPEPSDLGETYFSRFVDRVRHLEVFRRLGTADPRWPVSGEVLGVLARVLPLDGEALRCRIENLVVVLSALVAEEERRSGGRGLGTRTPDDTITVVTAMLLAPPTPARG